MHINLQAVEEQFADTDHDLTVRRKVKFQSTTRDADQAIEINFERSLPNGWSITRESERKVVCFGHQKQNFTTIHLVNFCKRR